MSELMIAYGGKTGSETGRFALGISAIEYALQIVSTEGRHVHHQ